MIEVNMPSTVLNFLRSKRGQCVLQRGVRSTLCNLDATAPVYRSQPAPLSLVGQLPPSFWRGLVRRSLGRLESDASPVAQSSPRIATPSPVLGGNNCSHEPPRADRRSARPVHDVHSRAANIERAAPGSQSSGCSYTTQTARPVVRQQCRTSGRGQGKVGAL